MIIYCNSLVPSPVQAHLKYWSPFEKVFQMGLGTGLILQQQNNKTENEQMLQLSV